MKPPSKPRWTELFHAAVAVIEQTEYRHDLQIDWTFGGGTALMIQIGHRDSYDVDIFVDDPQVLALLNPETQDFDLDTPPDSCERNGHHALRLVFNGVGEIDFICGAMLLDQPTSTEVLHGHRVALETPAEIVAKKLVYRGDQIQPRDLFDVAAVSRFLGADVLARQLKPVAAEARTALTRAQALTPHFVRDINADLHVEPDYADLVEAARGMAIETLETVTH